MEITIEINNNVVYTGLAEDYLFQNEYDDELEMFLSDFETSGQCEVEYNGMMFYKELPIVFVD